jgi:hypothetical protein
VYLADLRRLAKLADVENEKLLMRTFIVGLPSAVSRALRALTKVDELSLSDIVSKARAYTSELSTTFVDNSIAAVSRVNIHSTERGEHNGKTAENQQRKTYLGGIRRCFRCNGPHLIRECTATGKAISDMRMREVSQGNASGKVAAPVTFPM